MAFFPRKYSKSDSWHLQWLVMGSPAQICRCRQWHRRSGCQRIRFSTSLENAFSTGSMVTVKSRLLGIVDANPVCRKPDGITLLLPSGHMNHPGLYQCCHDVIAACLGQVQLLAYRPIIPSGFLDTSFSMSMVRSVVLFNFMDTSHLLSHVCHPYANRFGYADIVFVYAFLIRIYDIVSVYIICPCDARGNSSINNCFRAILSNGPAAVPVMTVLSGYQVNYCYRT